MQLASRADWRQRFVRGFAALVGGVALSVLTGCATHYVDGATKGVQASAFKRPAAPAPVQFLYEFETKGVANAQATDYTRKMVQDQVSSSGLFSSIESKPVAGGALLSVKLNNVPMQDDAFSKGFVTGLTFGLAGSQVSDGYICTVSYTAPGQQQPIVKTARHVIHTTIGAAKSPGDAKEVKDIGEAVTMMTNQVLSTALNDLSQDPSFR